MTSSPTHDTDCGCQLLGKSCMLKGVYTIDNPLYGTGGEVKVDGVKTISVQQMGGADALLKFAVGTIGTRECYVLPDTLNVKEQKDREGFSTPSTTSHKISLVSRVRDEMLPCVFKAAAEARPWTLVLTQLPKECSLCHKHGNNVECLKLHQQRYIAKHNKLDWCQDCKTGNVPACRDKDKAAYARAHDPGTLVMDGWIPLAALALGLSGATLPAKIVVLPVRYVQDTHHDCAWCDK